MPKWDKDYIYVPIEWKRKDIIKVLRTINNITPQKLSIVTGIPRYVLYEYEHGWRPITQKDAEKLAKTLRTYEWIFNKENWSVEGIDFEELHPVFGEWVTMA